MKLKQLLSIEELANSPDPTAQFKEIAEQLFNNYCIKKGDTIYQFLELEFYLYSEAHPDIITYPRNTELGDWFFHQSGVDICFETTLNPQRSIDELIPVNEHDVFGGILIKSLRKFIPNGVPEGEPIYGPLNCMYDLFDQFSAIKPTSMNNFEYPYIIKRINPIRVNVDKCARYFRFVGKEDDRTEKYSNLIKDNYDNQKIINETEFTEFLNADYRFFVKDEFIKNQEGKWLNEKLKKYAAKPKL